MTRSLRLLLWCVLIPLLGADAASAQGASVGGRLVDAQGAAVAGAEVTLAGPAGPRTVRSAADGQFEFAAVAPGSYSVTVTAPGFATVTQPVSVSGPARLTIALQVEGVNQDVTVRGALVGTTATGKTTLPLRELPLTINAVSADTIFEQGDRDLVAALANVPNVNAFTTYGVYEYYAFRGFLDSVQLVDGVRNEGNRINTQLTNIERVEVLKGPSSALYGGGALGGTVNLIRKKPGAARGYEFLGSVGSWETWRGALGATGRLDREGRLLYRLDLGAENANGYRHNDATRLTMTPSLAWRAGDTTQLNVYYTFNRDRFSGDAGLPLVDPDLGVPTKENVLDVPRDRNYRTPQDQATSYDNNLQVAFARQLTNSLGFRDTLSYRHFNDEYFLSEGVTFAPPTTILRDYLYFKHHRRPLFNIAELTGYFAKGLQQNLVIGWEAQRYHNRTTLPEEDFFAAAPIDAFNPVETQGLSDLTPARANVFTNNNQAFYIQDHLTLTARLKLLLGGRYDIYRRQSHSDVLGNGGSTSGPTTRRQAEAFTSRVGLVYAPASSVDLYGSFATAFKPPTLAQPDGSSLDPETGSQFEFGNRLRLIGDRIQLNTAVFRILRQDVAFRRPGNVYVQAGEVESKGFEADLQTTLSAQWNVTAGYGFTDAALLDYQESPTTNLRGNTPIFAPRHTFNLWTGYQWSSGFGVNLGARYFGRTFADNANTFEVDGYGVMNLAARYRRGRLEYALNVNNVTDNEYFIAHQDYLQVYPGNPVNLLATVRVRMR